MREAIERFMWVSAIKPGMEEAFVEQLAAQQEQLQSNLRERGAIVCSVFREGNYLFTYLESAKQIDSIWTDAEMLTPLLQAWPSLDGEAGTYELRMNDIFHDDWPNVDEVPWRHSGYRAEQRIGSLARLKPEMYSSYVFLHYQLQEEKPRLFSKYYMIGSFDQYIFSYNELPSIVEQPRVGQLTTTNSPPDWGEAMEPHFEPWTEMVEAERLWCVMEEFFSL
ncbi:hypothetical protein A8990_110139 [Paenibacillus taihuensis]|uniref:NIPSNAP protein n=1 Tax=Paenibacillus taihuensis TaxID=1156355 RepID=A0A3D9SD23_9BACL|nr:hypothetical protein [Paenibacillus taihuensis]REE86529.1 hypothetical protein A8990_110139 [Paenibacillus taihuensis]